MTATTPEGTYHHGNLREALLEAALGEIASVGTSGLSLREVARRAGVSHAAPRHHFGDKAGLLAAIAADGYRRLAGATEQAVGSGTDLRDVGLAYVRFASDNPAHFAVMFRPELYASHDVEVAAARDTAARVLVGAVERELPDASDRMKVSGVVAAWAISHGFATLWLAGNLDFTGRTDPVDAAREAFDAMVLIARAETPDLEKPPTATPGH